MTTTWSAESAVATTARAAPREHFGVPVAMVGVKGGVPRVGPSEAPLSYRAEPAFATEDVASLWHVKQEWRPDNLPPPPAAVATLPSAPFWEKHPGKIQSQQKNQENKGPKSC